MATIICYPAANGKNRSKIPGGVSGLVVWVLAVFWSVILLFPEMGLSAVSGGRGHLVLGAEADARLSAVFPDRHYGGADTVKIKTDETAVFRFDTGAIPAGAAIESATLRLTQCNGEGEGAKRFRIHRISEPWDETGVTFTSAPAWGDPVGQSRFEIGRPGSVLMIDVPVSIVEEWIGNNNSNHGLAITTVTGWHPEFAAREHADPGWQPVLAVVYSGGGSPVGNTAPVACHLSVQTREAAAVDIRLPAYDAESESLTYFLLEPPSRGTLSGTAPHLVYTPDAGFTGSEVFTYQASDSELASAIATVRISVRPHGADLTETDWSQDMGNAQRSGHISLEPAMPWHLAWTWNGPDAQGGAGAHVYHAPQAHVPWEARTCAGPDRVYVPASVLGLYALDKNSGAVVWHFAGDPFDSAPAFDHDLSALFAASRTGLLYRIDASTGSETGRYSLSGAVVKSVLLTNDAVYAVTGEGTLHRVNKETLQPDWIYPAESPAQTPPSYSAVCDRVVFCTADLNVHCLNAADGTVAWRVKPSVNTPGYPNEFEGSWPVIAEQHGIVFVRQMVGKPIWSGGGPGNRWPDTNADIRRRLEDLPRFQNLFALSLSDGTKRFIPAVGPGGVEDIIDGAPRLRVNSMPVIKVVDGREVAYVQWRNGQSGTDGRWDSHLGEMVLDHATVPGYTAGDVRFVEFGDSQIHITDEQCPVSMAGNTLFHAHWGASEAVAVADRSDFLGMDQAHPIQTDTRPPVIRRLSANGSFDPVTHWTDGQLSLFNDGRYWGSRGWWVYWNVLDPPTPDSHAYSGGILPRYTYVTGNRVIVQGNGGELFVMEHSGP